MDTQTIRSLIDACKNMRVLYVEDDKEVRLQTHKMLSIYFPQITSAIDGEEAWAMFRSQSFDIVFTDISMSRMDGLTLIGEIRRKDPGVPIVVFSAYDNPEYLLTTIKFGIQGYLLKPFQSEEFIQTLQKIVTSRPKSASCNLVLAGGYCWDRRAQCLCYEENEVPLSKREIALFDLLTSSKHRICSSEEIEIAVFDDDTCDNKRVRSLLSRLRKKLSCDLICSVYGEGYKLQWHHE